MYEGLTGINEHGLTEGQMKTLQAMETWKHSTREDDLKREYKEQQEARERTIEIKETKDRKWCNKTFKFVDELDEQFELEQGFIMGRDK